MIKTLILAGGCFWCLEHDMRKVTGVVSVTSGYSGGDTNLDQMGDFDDMATREDFAGHREVVLVEYDDSKTSYKKIVQYFLNVIDPTDEEGQFTDRGDKYAPAIFCENEEERDIAKSLLGELQKSGIYENPVVVAILLRKPFYQAEEYHQNYATKHETKYGLYRLQSGRADFVQNICEIRKEKNINWNDM